MNLNDKFLAEIHSSCEQLRFQLKTGAFNQKQTDYLRTERTGRLDLIDALKYCCVNLRWNELLLPDDKGPMAVGPGQIFVRPRLGPFGRASGQFSSGVIRRPV